MSVTETTNHSPLPSVSEGARMSFLPALFPGCVLRGENAVYDWASRFSPTYTGALWDFRTDDRGVRYMAPLGYDTFKVEQSMNGFEGEMSADAYGIFCTVMGLSQMLQVHQDNEDLFANFERLRDHAYDHPESEALIAALD